MKNFLQAGLFFTTFFQYLTLALSTSFKNTICNTDDIIIGYWIRKQGYELKVIPNSSVKVIHDAADTEQLRNTNLKGGNKVCYDFIKTQENNVFIIITLLLFLVVGTQYPISAVFLMVAFFLVASFLILKVGY